MTHSANETIMWRINEIVIISTVVIGRGYRHLFMSQVRRYARSGKLHRNCSDHIQYAAAVHVLLHTFSWLAMRS